MPSQPEGRGNRRTVHAFPAAPFGGVQALVPLIARTQLDGGRQVELVTFGKTNRLAQFLADQNIDVPLRHFGGVWAPLATLWYIVRHRDVIWHSHCEPFWVTVLVAAAGPRRWVVHLHDYPERSSGWKSRLACRINRLFSRRWIAISESVGAAWTRSGHAPATRIDLAYNSIRLSDEPIYRTRGTVFNVGFVGRIVRMKGVFDFVRLAAAMGDDARFAFHVYGDGSELEAARQQAANMGIADKLTFHGFAADMSEVWRSLDAVMVFSTREPFGLVVLEAIANGVGVVVYENDSGASEIAAIFKSPKQVSVGDLAEAAAVLKHWQAHPQTLDHALNEDQKTLRRDFNLKRLIQDIDACYSLIDTKR